MSKAKERAEKKYPAWRNCIGDEFSSNSAYYGFIEGYHQAEKDLELSWEDIKKIETLCFRVDRECDLEEKEYYQEVLKRFKEHRKDRRILKIY